MLRGTCDGPGLALCSSLLFMSEVIVHLQPLALQHLECLTSLETTRSS